MKQFSNAFELIKNLSMSEKRYFKIFSERHVIGNQNKYINIFDFLDKHDEEDDDKLTKKLSKLGIKADFLAADKNYLYHLILRSLLSFHHNKTNTILLTEQLFIIEILYEKGLYNLCIKEIEKSKQIAEKIENYALLIEFTSWERKAKGYSKGFDVAYATNKEINNYLEIFNNQQKFTDLYYESLRYRYKGFKAREASQIQEFQKILKNPLLKSEDNAQSLLAKIRYHLIFANFYYVKDEETKEQEHLERLIELMDNSDYYPIENPFDYIYVYNYFLALKKKGKEKEFYESLDKFRKFPEKVKISKEKVTLQVFIFSYLNEFSMLIDKHRFKDTLDLISKMEKGLEDNKHVIEPSFHINFYYLFAHSYIANGQHKKALKYINNIINEYKEEQREDYFNHAQLLNMVVHFELGHLDLLDYLYNSTVNYFKKRNKLYQTENLVLTFFKKIKKGVSESELKEHYLELKSSLDLLKQSKFEKAAFDLFNFNLWVDAKLKKCSIAEL